MHILAYVGYLNKPEKREEWIYKTKTDDEGKVIDFIRKSKPSNREEALRNIVGYFLSHTATLREGEGKYHTIRWFGSCSYNKFKTKEEQQRGRGGGEELKCKICGGELMPFWEWKRKSYGDVKRKIRNKEIEKPRYWEEVERAVEGKDPPPDAEEYLV